MSVAGFVPRLASAVELGDWCAVFSEGHREVSGDPALPGALAARLLAEEDDGGPLRWAARANTPTEGAVGGGLPRIVGAAELRRQEHDARIGFLRLFVAPPARRNGVGTALLARVAADARTAGYERIQATAPAGGPGEAFARAWGGVRELLRLELQEQRLDEHVLTRCRELATCPDPARYEPAHWYGAAPDPLADSFGQVMSHVLDAPGATLQLAPRAWDRAAVRAWEAGMTGEHLLVTAALHRTTGHVAAATVITVAAGRHDLEVTAASQHDTAVLPQHRGRGLARWIKAEQTLRLHARFPSVRTITATVNTRNHPMLAVNRAVGYRTIAERLLLENPL
ncbi:GNAT family N-acetyltransferase [Nonomuraea rubra]